MTLWARRFRDHALWPAVHGARAKINDLQVVPGSSEENEILAYVGQCIELLERRREETDALEVTPAALLKTQQAVENWSNALDNVLNGAWTMLEMVPSTDQVLDSLSSWPPLKPARYMSGIAAATESFGGKVQDALDAISGDFDDVREKLAALTKSEADIRDAIDVEKQRISEAIADFKTESAEAVDKVVAEKAKSVDESIEEWATRRTDQDREAQELLEALRGHEETAKSTVHATTAYVVATDYGKYARNKSVSAWVCDVAAAVVGGAGVAAILIHLFTLDDTADGNVGISMTRLAASLGTLGIAALLGRRGAQHHREARAAKRTDLALRRVMPFIVDLPVEEQQEIVLDFTERVFIRGELDPSSTESSKSFRERIDQIRSRRATKASEAEQMPA